MHSYRVRKYRGLRIPIHRQHPNTYTLTTLFLKGSDSLFLLQCATRQIALSCYFRPNNPILLPLGALDGN
jgi:hypothetical protein